MTGVAQTHPSEHNQLNNRTTVLASDVLFQYSLMECRLTTLSIAKILLRLWRTNKYAVVELTEALRYKPEGRGFDSR